MLNWRNMTSLIDTFMDCTSQHYRCSCSWRPKSCSREGEGGGGGEGTLPSPPFPSPFFYCSPSLAAALCSPHSFSPSKLCLKRTGMPAMHARIVLIETFFSPFLQAQPANKHKVAIREHRPTCDKIYSLTWGKKKTFLFFWDYSGMRNIHGIDSNCVLLGPSYSDSGMNRIVFR